ncbi:hypothetical protein L6164_010824 [Bauhinia variegata]|uniref:Uncharacterized protein n=1 Tax=Bauhinia variegata TaxID=167791 RepID=A0ACB9P3G9_BAUVA|nr:hypothetical protein L6164_010824 [Bauhinia variegata]
MSMDSSCATRVSQTTRKENLEGESFHNFFDCWLAEQNQHLQELFAAASTHAADVQLIERVIKHYESYYMTKSKWTKTNVLRMLSPTWRSSLEEAFLWIGGWRPSMAFHLLYSKSGLQFEASLKELIQGLEEACDLGSLSAAQLAQMDELHRRTVMEERKITEKMAKHQETVVDAQWWSYLMWFLRLLGVKRKERLVNLRKKLHQRLLQRSMDSRIYYRKLMI